MFRGRVVAPGEPLWLDDDRDEAVALLARYGAFTQLRELMLGANPIGPTGAQAIAQRLDGAASLTSLQLGYTAVKQQTVFARETSELRPTGPVTLQD